METFIYIVFSVLSLVGVATVIRGAVSLIFKSKAEKKLFTVLLLDNNNTEIVIRDTVEQMRSSKYMPSSILALDNGMDEKTKMQAKLLLDDYNITLCNAENIGLKMTKG